MNRRQFLKGAMAAGVTAAVLPDLKSWVEDQPEDKIYSDNDYVQFCPKLWAEEMMKSYKENMAFMAFING